VQLSALISDTEAVHIIVAGGFSRCLFFSFLFLLWTILRIY